MKTNSIASSNAPSVWERIDTKYRPVWDGRRREDQMALAQYFLPHGSQKHVLSPTRPRIVKWYCPFASQQEFPTGHRYCINVYTGCSHRCVYCYAAGYERAQANIKKDFQTLILKDMQDLQRFDVPPAPVHLSNSTDPFQPLEREFSHTKCALEQILANRHRFTTVTILTKNPLLAAQPDYLDLFRELADLPAHHPRHEEFTGKGLPGFVIEVSLAFWRETARSVYDPGAPTVEERIQGIGLLRQAGIPVVLRIDPLLPRSPLRERPPATLAEFGLEEAQTLEDLESLVAFAKAMNARHVVYSPAKIVKPRGAGLSETMQALRAAYQAVAGPEKLVWRGRSWRLPQDVAEARVVRPFLEICQRHGVRAKYCKQNLIETP
jgi:DNA repair photolyase